MRFGLFLDCLIYFFKKLRCRFILVPDATSSLQMCKPCSTRSTGVWQNKDSCFNCKAILSHGVNNSIAGYCLNHQTLRTVPNGMFKCGKKTSYLYSWIKKCNPIFSQVFCNQMFNKTNPIFSPIEARLCVMCSNGNRCCFIG